MKFRLFLLKLQVWRRFRVAKRREKRLLLQLEREKRAFQAKYEAQESFYQKQLAVERKRFELLHTEWANRFLQSQGLGSVSIATADLEEKVLPHLKNQPPKADEWTDLLTFDQKEYFQDLKDNFWRQGIEQGKSEADIYTVWKDSVEAQAIEDARQAIN